jgi:ribosomal protein S18 acetylase RimI-like enzyme
MVTRIVQASSESEIDAARTLFGEYAAWLDLDLSFQGFAAELAALPGEYTLPRGALLLALDDEAVLGCVGLRPLDWPHTAELKRLYVRPEARGRRVGSLLAQAAVSRARDAGYERVRLDTLPAMVAARRLYEALGFREIHAYRFNPVAEAAFMELDLDAASERADQG